MAKSTMAHDYAPPVRVAEQTALRALSAGQASPEQQKLFMDWLLVDVCGLKESCYRAGKPDDTAFLEGRRFVGLFLAGVLTKKFVEPKGDTHE
jgi:hypothetical protein